METATKHYRYFILMFLLLAGPLSAASTELNAPQLVIKETSDLVSSMLATDRDALANDKALLLQAVNDILEPRLNLDKVSRLVLGKHWRKATPLQRTDFQKEFKMLLFNTYASSFTEIGEWELSFSSMKIKPNAKRVIVKTEILQPSKPVIAVNYRMAVNKQGEWKIYDIIIEGISMVTNYKSGFASRIKKSGGLDKVIQDLAAKNHSLSSDKKEKLAVEASHS